MIHSYKTLTGLSLLDAFRKLDAELEPQAYKPISGGKGQALGLTDISPAYLPQVLMETFGPLGLGWFYRIGRMEAVAGVDSKGNQKWDARCEVIVVYQYLNEKGEIQISFEIPATGGSDNSEREWAEKGALTNALGTAWFFAGWQLSVYQGKRSHQTVRATSKPAGAPAATPAPAPAPKAPPKVFISQEGQQKVKEALKAFPTREGKLALLRAATKRDINGLLDVLEEEVPAILTAALEAA